MMKMVCYCDLHISTQRPDKDRIHWCNQYQLNSSNHASQLRAPPRVAENTLHRTLRQRKISESVSITSLSSFDLPTWWPQIKMMKCCASSACLTVYFTLYAVHSINWYFTARTSRHSLRTFRKRNINGRSLL